MATIAKPQESSFDQYAGEVYGWAYRLLGRHHDALDVVQDVFMRWDTQCRRQTPQRPRGWLRRVTLNRAIDLRRQRKTNPDLATGSLQFPATAADPGAGVEREELRSDITEALDQLSEIQRGVLVAKVYDGMTFAEIATELGVTPSTIKTHFVRAVRAVRDKLGQRWS